MELSIAIVNWNTRDLLSACLRSVEKDVRLWEPSDVEVFVVDNASTDHSAAMVRECFPWVHLIENAENAGFARANNQVLLQARGRYVVLLNSDTDVHADAFRTLVAFMEAHPQAGACGPRLLNTDGRLQPSCHPMLTPGREFWRLMLLDRIWRRATYVQHRWDLSDPRQVEVIKGACFVLRREALDQVGLLDEQYFMYTEEMDLCYRLHQAGWELWWVPGAVVTHHGEASTHQVAETMYVELYRSKAQFHHKFGGASEDERFRRLLRIAYVPRWALFALAGLFVPALSNRARVYRSLLRELAAPSWISKAG